MLLNICVVLFSWTMWENRLFELPKFSLGKHGIRCTPWIISWIQLNAEKANFNPSNKWIQHLSYFLFVCSHLSALPCHTPLPCLSPLPCHTPFLISWMMGCVYLRGFKKLIDRRERWKEKRENNKWQIVALEMG